MPDEIRIPMWYYIVSTVCVVLGIAYLVMMDRRRFCRRRIQIEMHGIDVSRVTHRMDGQRADHPAARLSAATKAARVAEARQRVANQSYFSGGSVVGDKPVVGVSPAAEPARGEEAHFGWGVTGQAC